MCRVSTDDRRRRRPAKPPAIYVPASELGKLLNQDREGVLLPKAEYDALLGDAKPNDAAVQPSGVVLSSGDYSAAIRGNQLLLTARISATSFNAEGWESVPLRLAGASVEAASSGDGPATVSRQAADQSLVWLLRAGGQHELTLELSAPLQAAGSDRIVALEFPVAATGKLTLTLPAAKRLEVDGVKFAGTTADDGETVYSIPVGGRGQVAAPHHRRQ
ncbi:MAG: hypothetical protein R3B90_16460 [Planctomycetaceae bacterium]